MKDLKTNMDVKMQLGAIVSFELKNLRDTMDYLQSHKVEFEENNAPTINLRADDDHFVQWVIRKVTWDDDDVVRLNAHKWDCPYHPDDVDDFDCNEVFDTFNDEDFRNALVPGEITELNNRIMSDYEGISRAYIFDNTQKLAIANFNEAAKMLDDAGVSVIIDNEDMQTYFVNANAVEDIAEVDDDGRKELDLNVLPKTAHVIDFMFFASDGVFAKPKTK